ncbi:TVP38/TMEM64 family protein [Corynebacterium lizhenjunii]|nr:VTT domain-containing protein [Corynebacterium lizhenjunii]
MKHSPTISRSRTPARTGARVRQMLDFAGGLGKHTLATLRTWPRRRWALLAVTALAAGTYLWLVGLPDVARLRAWAGHTGAWFPVVFWLSYVFFTLFPLPRTLWTVAAGLFFGPTAGILLSLSALTASAALAFAGVRRMLGEWMRPHLRHPAVARLNLRLERRGWLSIGGLRMVAGVPFPLLNYAAALSPVSFSHFLLGTAVGSIPTTVIGVVFGDALIQGSSPGLLVAMVLLAAVGVATLVLDARTARTARDAR